MTNLNFKWYTLVYLSILLLLPLVSSQQAFVFGEDVDIKHSVRLDGAVDPTLTCNLTVFSPNRTTIVDFEPMTNGTNYYNYTIDSDSILNKGAYDYDITCTNSTLSTTQSFSFFINPGGLAPTEERTNSLSRTIWMFFIFSILCFISLFFVRSFPFKITLFLLLIWFILMAVNISFVAISDEVVNPNIENFMSFFIVLATIANRWIFYVIGVFWLITAIVNIIQLKKTRRRERFA